jgi:hypothetical protein
MRRKRRTRMQGKRAAPVLDHKYWRGQHLRRGSPWKTKPRNPVVVMALK